MRLNCALYINTVSKAPPRGTIRLFFPPLEATIWLTVWKGLPRYSHPQFLSPLQFLPLPTSPLRDLSVCLPRIG